METYKVKLTNTAVSDLDQIYAYIAGTLQEPGTAINLVEKLENEILSLKQMPYRCPQRHIGIYADKGYRQLFVKNFTVVYRIDELEKQVIIVTVRYSRSEF